MFCLAAGASGAVLLFQAQQHANTGHNQQHTNAAEQQGAETTGGGQVEALAVDDDDLCIFVLSIAIHNLGGIVVMLNQFTRLIKGFRIIPFGGVVQSQVCVNRL